MKQKQIFSNIICDTNECNGKFENFQAWIFFLMISTNFLMWPYGWNLSDSWDSMILENEEKATFLRRIVYYLNTVICRVLQRIVLLKVLVAHFHSFFSSLFAVLCGFIKLSRSLFCWWLSLHVWFISDVKHTVCTVCDVKCISTQSAFMSLSFLIRKKIVHEMNGFVQILFLIYSCTLNFQPLSMFTYTLCAIIYFLFEWPTFNREQIFLCRDGRFTCHFLLVSDITNPMREKFWLNLIWK